jgi:hypothetical protein
MSEESSNSSNVTCGYSEMKPTVIREPQLDPLPLGERVTLHVHLEEASTPAFTFEHDAAQGVFRLRMADGTVEVFRDKPARYLCVEPDPTGVMKPVTKYGRPVILYLCREEREVG